MQFLRNLPVKRKLMFVVLATCGTILLLVCASLFTLQLYLYKQTLARDLRALTEVVAANSTGAVSFGDKVAATEVLSALMSRPQIVAIGIHLPDGSHWVHVGASDKRASLETPIPADTAHFQGRECYIVQPIKLKGETLGTLHVRADFNATYRDLAGFYALILAAVLGGSLFVAVVLSTRLQRVISEPIQQLAAIVRVVTEQKDYSVRAQKLGRDEVGLLTEAFNDMLSQIQSRDAALNLSQRKLEALIHSIDGIVWECDTRTNEFTFVSRQSESILGYTPEECLGRPNFWDEKLHPDDAVQTSQIWQDVVARRQPYEHEYRMLAKDGHTVWIHESGVVLVENDRPVVVRGIFQDITQRRSAAAELARLNSELMTASRQAGMAEVATGVLHNVGNVLNSVSVSATLVGDRLRQSKIANLCRATAMLREQNGQLVEFLTSDPKGKLLPEYLGTVADQLAREQTELIAEMNSVGQHIEHIKEIVAMQQSYAKISGAFENLSAAGLVEDALRMNTAAFERHRIQVVREFDEKTPAVCVDRHKVLQILINLLRNAKYAMDGQKAHDKRLVIRVGLASPNRVKITVCDNGVGIAPENLIKIFGHGFTTKKDGHGFGLHSGANAAKEMGGSLTALSAGVGHGAEFTLELPVAATVQRRPNPADQETVLITRT
ncbi:MAG: PAS domain S-box protein [Pedosphaera sp.]|nr:PAS domain S-box protein [Pedosphaera sp.]